MSYGITRKRIAEIERTVAERYGASAPYPKADVIDRWIKWERRDWSVKNVPDLTPAEMQRAVRRRDKLKVPAGYLSWEHIGAFLELAR